MPPARTDAVAARDARARGAAAPAVALPAWAAAFALLAVLAACAWQGPDIFYHLFLGKRALETGAFQPGDPLLVRQPQYVNVYWLFQIVCQGLFAAGGIRAASALFIAAWLATFWLWIRAARLTRSPALGLPLMVAAVLASQWRFEPRPEVLSYLFLIAQIGWLSAWDFRAPLGWRRYAAIGLTEALWANVHGYFVFGPFLVAARLASALARREGKRAVASAAGLLAVACLASILSPFGPRTWAFAATLASFLRQMRGAIAEFGPPTGVFLAVWTTWLFWSLWALCIVICLTSLARRRGSLFAFILAAAGLALSATSVRNMPLLPLLMAPALADFTEPSPLRARPPLGARPSPPAAKPRRPAMAPPAPAFVGAAGLVALALSAWAVTGGLYRSIRSETRFGIGLPHHTYPVRFADALRQSGFRGRLFNNAADGGYLEYFCPDVRPYMDSRYVDALIVREYFDALGDPRAFQRLDVRHRFDGALLKIADSPGLVTALLAGGGWTLAYADLHRAFFVRAVPEEGAPAAWSTPARRFYQGDDLGDRANGMAAIQWTGVLVSQPDRALLIEALRQFAQAPRIPSFVILYALQFAFQHGDHEVADLARGMRPRMLALEAASGRQVDELLRAVPGR